MPTHHLTRDGDEPNGEWELEWDDTIFTLSTPDGQPVMQADPGQVYGLIDLADLLVEGKIAFATPHGPLSFQKNRAASADLRAVVERSLGSDPDAVAQLRRGVGRIIFRGLVAFVAGGGLFGAYCWWAFTAGDPPPGTWARWVLETFGWAIHGLLLVLVAAGLAGPWVMFMGVRLWWRVRRIERAIAAG